MQSSKIQEVETVFHEVLELPPEEREGYLAQACSGNAALYAEVWSLISAADSGASGFMDEPAVSLGLTIISQNSEQSLVGKSLAAYLVIARLGRGGMGEVYLAEDTRLGRKVALKFLSQELLHDNWAKRQLVKEAQAAAMLDHPNICPVYGIEEVDGHIFIVMQYVEGQTLLDAIRAQSIGPEDVVNVARQIAGALEEAHAHGIIHRDIKPRNIMVTPSGQVKVLDFGLAKTVTPKIDKEPSEFSNSRITSNGFAPGTIAYMSPEQLRDERLDFRSDLFSLGAVLYEIMEGRRLFARESEAEMISAILTDTKHTYKKPNSKIAQIIQKCLEKNRDERFRSASELLISLKSITEVSKNGFMFVRGSAFWNAVYLFSAVALILTVVLLIKWARQPTDATPVDAAVTGENSRAYSLAVLPVKTDKTAKNSDYLKRGLPEDLIRRLSVTPGLKVRPYTSVANYEGQAVDAAKIVKELNVNAVLALELFVKDGRTMLGSRLTKADGLEIWSDEEAMDWQSILSIQDRIVQNVNHHLTQYQMSDEKFAAARGTSNSEAYKQFMLGRYYWRNRDKEKLPLAIDYFTKAIALDPLYAQAYAGRADSYVLLNLISFGKVPTEEAMAKARADAREAIALDPNMAEAHTSLGVIYLRYEWRWDAAELELQKAIQLNPDYATAHYWYSNLLFIMGHPEQSLEESQKAKDLEPFNAPTVLNYCRILSRVRPVEQGLACFEKLEKEHPESDHIKYGYALLKYRSNQQKDAIAMFERIYAKDKTWGAALAYARARSGNLEGAKKVLTEMLELSRHQYIPPQEFAIIYAGMGDTDNAFAWLEKEYIERFGGLIYLTVEPLFQPLRSDPRYYSMVNRLNLPALNTAY
jgi:serine/threonine-protein kinase